MVHQQGDTQRFQSMLQRDPGDVGAFRELRQAYLRERRWPDLCRLYERRAEVVDGTAESIACLFSAGDLWVEAAADPGRAVECFRSVLQFEPNNGVALDALEEAYRAAGRNRDLLELLQARAAREDAPGRQGETFLRIAEVLLRELQRSGEAVGYLLKAYRANPFLRDRAIEGVTHILAGRPREQATLEQIQSFFREIGEWDRVIELYERRSELAGDAQEKANLLCDLAQCLQERYLGQERVLRAYAAAAEASPLQPERILQGLTRVLADDPSCRPAMAALRTVYGDLYRWNEVLELLGREAELATGVESAELTLQMGIIEEERLFRPDRAIAHYHTAFRQAPSLGPQVHERLLSLSEQGDSAPLARRVLADVLRATGDWSELVRLLLESRASAPSPRERHDLTLQAAEVWIESLGDPVGARELFLEVLQQDGSNERAMAGLRRVLELRPNDATSLAELRAIYEAQQRWKELAGLLEQRIAHLDDPHAQAELHYELGTLWEQHLGRREAAMSHYQTAFRLVPRNQRFIEAGRRIYRQMRRWPMVVRLLEIELAVTQDPTRRAELLLDTAGILRRHLRQPVAAGLALLDILEGDPGHGPARREARAVLGLAEDREQVFQRLERRAESDEDMERSARLLALLGDLFTDDPADPAVALRAYRRAHAADPEGREILEKLVAALSEAGEWADLVDVYERAAARELDAAREEQLRVEAARILIAELHTPTRAAQQLRRALEMNPANTGLLEQLRHLLLEHDRWRELGELYRWSLNNVPGLDDPAQRRGLLLQWAQVCLGPMGDREAAAEPYGLLLDLDPTDREALEFYQEHLSARSEWELLLSLYDRAWAAAPDGSRGLVALAARVAEERLGDVEGAIERWLACLLRWPGEREARQALEALYSRTRRFGDLIALLVGQADAVAEPGEQIDLLRQAAEVACEAAGDLPRAEAILTRLLSLAPDDLDALETLGELHESRGDFDALVINLQHQAALAQTAQHRAELHRERARVLSRRLERYSEALADVERVLEERPEDRGALELGDEIAGRLKEPLRQLDFLGRLEKQTTTAEAKVALLMRMAALAEEQLEDVPRAVNIRMRVLQLKPGDRETLQALARLHEARGDWQQVATVLRWLAEGAPALTERGSWLARLGEVYQQRMGDLDRAREAWQQVLEIDPEEPHAIARLQELFDAQKDWARLAEVLARRIRLEGDPAEAVALLQRRASILEASLSRPRQAILALEEARERIPGEPKTLHHLRRLLLEQGEFRRAVETIEEELDSAAAADPVLGVQLCFAAAGVWRDRIKDPQGAVEWFRRALGYAPGHREALEALKALYRRQGDTAALADVVAQLRGGARDDSERVDLLMEQGDIAREVGDAPAAFRFFRQAHQMQPTSGRSLAAMRRLAETHGMWDPLIEVLQWSMVRKETTDEKLAVLSQIAQIQEQRLGDPGRTFATLQLAFRLRPQEGPTLAALRRLAPAAERWPGYLECLGLLLKERTRPHARSQVHHVRARVLEQELGDVDGAFAELRAAFQLDPTDDATRQEIEQLAERSGHWEPLLEVFRELLDKVENLRAQVFLLQRIARIQEERLEQPGAALESLARAFSLDALNPQVEAELNRVGEASGAWEALSVSYGQAVARAQEPRVKARFVLRLAQITEGPLADPLQAFDHYRAAFRLDPRSERPVKELQRLAEHVDGGWEALLQLFSAAANQEPSVEVEAGLRRRCLRILEEQPRDADEATPHLIRLWLLDEASEDELRRLAGRLREEEAWDQLLRVHQSVLARTLDPERRAARLFQIADIQERHDEDPRATISTLRMVLKEQPGNLQALRTLSRIHLAHAHWEQALRCMEEQTPLLPPDEARALGARIAAIWDKELGRPDRAARRLLRVIEEHPAHPRAFQELEGLYEREGNWEDLLDLLQTSLERSTEREQRLSLLWKMAHVAWDRFDNRKRAVRCLTLILVEDPTNGPALERMAAFYRDERRWGDLLDVLERQTSAAAEAETAATFVIEIGHIHEGKLFSRKRAIEAFERAVALTPRNQEPLVALDRLYEEVEEFERCAQVRQLRAEAATGTPEQGRLLLQWARLLLGPLADPQAAEQPLRRALELDPSLGEELDALRARLVGQKGRDARLVLLRVQEPQARTPAERATLLCEMGRIEEECGRSEAAFAHYRRALEARPDHLPALAALNSLHRAAGDWAEVDRCIARLVGLLGDRAATEGASDAESAGEPAGADLGELYLDWARVALLLEDRGRAVARLEQALEVDPSNHAARRALADLHYEDEHWEAAERYYAALLSAPDPDAPDALVATWLFRVARAQEESGRHDEAAASLREVVQLDPDHAEAHRRLIHCLSAQGAWEETAAVLERLVTRTRDPGARYDLLTELGVLLHHRLGRGEAAQARLEEAHRLDPADPRALRPLLEILSGSRDHHRVIALADALAKASDDPEETRRLHCLRGRLFLEELHRLDEAAEAFRRALEVFPRDSEAVEGLVRSLEPHGEWEELAAIFADHVAALDQAAEPVPVSILLRLGRILHEHLDRHAPAMAVLDRALQQHPDHDDVHVARASLLEAMPSRQAEAVRELEYALELRPERLDVQHRLVNLLRGAGAAGRAYGYAEVVAFVRATTEEEQAFVGSMQRRMRPVEQLELGAVLLDPAVADAPLRGPVPEILSTLLEARPGLFHKDLMSLGIRRRDRMDQDRNHSLSLRFGEAQRALGLEGRALYVRAWGERGVEPLPCAPPAVAVGEALVRGLFRREQRFYLGRGLALTVVPHFLARSLDSTSGEALLRAVRCDDEPSSEAEAVWRDALRPVLADQDLAATLRERAAECVAGAYFAWQEAAERWACRLAMVLAGDLGVALKGLRWELAGDQRRALREVQGLLDLQRRSSLARDLVAWVRSARYGAFLELSGRWSGESLVSGAEPVDPAGAAQGPPVALASETLDPDAAMGEDGGDRDI